LLMIDLLPRAATGNPPLRVGLLLDHPLAPQHICDFVEWAQSRPDVAVTHLIIRAKSERSCAGLKRVFHRAIEGLGSLAQSATWSRLAFSLLNAFERAILRRNRRHFEYLHSRDLSDLVKGRVLVAPVKSKPDEACLYNAGDLQAVQELGLDLLLKCDGCTLDGEILQASRLGTIGVYQGDDNGCAEVGVGGFWEVYHRRDMTRLNVRQLAMGPGLLMQGQFPTRHYRLLNQSVASRKAAFYLKLTVARIACALQPPALAQCEPRSEGPQPEPGILRIGIYFFSLCQSLAVKQARKFLGIRERWHVAYLESDWRQADFSRGMKLPDRANHCLADPFVIRRNDRNYCFLEDLDYATNRGTIDVYECSAAGATRLGTALAEPFHLSFPYLFEHQDELYMCPESSQNRDIRIYKCVEFPLRWDLAHIAINGVSAADTMLFEKGGKWWMLTNIDSTGIGDYRSELYVFSAASPFESEWRPHPMNPVVVDSTRARNAGCFVQAGNYFRFAQGQAFDFYGKQIMINRVGELDDARYAESCLSVITPSFRPDAIGAHHLHSNGEVTAFDFCTRSRVDVDVP
jgi:hypothetical protein